MFKSLLKVFVVITLMVAFLGQAFAYASMTCNMSTESHQSHESMDHSSHLSSMNHEGMENSEMTHSKMQNHEECCGADCLCLISACTTVSIVNSVLSSANLVRMNDGVSLQKSNQTKSISSSLFRPPIFT